MNRVAVVGAGYTKFDEHWEKSLRDLSTEAGGLALADAGIEGSEVQALFVGNMSGGRFVGQEHLGALAAEQAGLLPIPAVRCEAACASGATALMEFLAHRRGDVAHVFPAIPAEWPRRILPFSVTAGETIS